MKKFKLAIGILVLFLLYKIISPFIIIEHKVASISKEKWIKDVEYLEKNLPKKHKNLFFNLEETEYKNLTKKLKEDIKDLSESEIKIRILEIIAKVGDSHTTVKNYNSSSEYPIKLYWFKEGLYITEVDSEYKELLGCKIIKINDVNIEDIVKSITTLVPHENQYWLKYKVVDYINNPEILKYFKVIEGEAAKLSLETIEGKTFEKEILPKDKINSNELVLLENNIKEKPLYMRTKESFWSNYISDEATLYIQINSCTPVKGKSVDSLVENTLKQWENEKINKLIIDLRNNTGGVYMGKSKSFVSNLSKMKDINKKGKLFIITGRKTFSSAINYSLDFKNDTNGLFYGEPTGGKPSHYGDVRNFTLPNSKLNISYSTKYFESTIEENTLMPDYLIEPSIKDYVNGIDPVIEEILKR